VIATAEAAPSAPPLVTPAGLERVTFRAMGTDVEVLLPVGHATAVASAVAVFAAWERRLSRFDPDSELSRLNARSGAPVVVPQAVFDVVATALDAACATDGVFDPTILRRLEDLGYDRTFAEIGRGDAHGEPAPPRRPWTAAWRNVRLDPRTRTIDLPPGIGIDLGGIAKGMAVDAALASLADLGLPVAAVNAGGDLAVRGTPPGTATWRIAVETRDGGEPVAIEGGALATSSTERRRWTRGGAELHHLVDPRTGLPARSGLISVTVAAHACAQAEVAAKTALILGLDDGSAFLARTGLSALAIDEAGVRHRIGAWLDLATSAPPEGAVPA